MIITIVLQYLSLSSPLGRAAKDIAPKVDNGIPAIKAEVDIVPQMFATIWPVVVINVGITPTTALDTDVIRPVIIAIIDGAALGVIILAKDVDKSLSPPGCVMTFISPLYNLNLYLDYIISVARSLFVYEIFHISFL